MAFGASLDEATGRAANRTAELYINLADNAEQLDPLAFAPVGRIVKGMESTVARLYSGYGEMQGESRAAPSLQSLLRYRSVTFGTAMQAVWWY